MKSLFILKKSFLKDAKIQKSYDELGAEFVIIEKLIEQRRKKGISQQVLARNVGTKQSAISRFESGKYNPTIQFLYKVADAIGIKIHMTVV